jgi:hypothetical protein
MGFMIHIGGTLRECQIPDQPTLKLTPRQVACRLALRIEVCGRRSGGDRTARSSLVTRHCT